MDKLPLCIKNNLTIKNTLALPKKIHTKLMADIKHGLHLSQCIVCNYSLKSKINNKTMLNYLCADCLSNLPLLMTSTASHLCILCAKIIEEQAISHENKHPLVKNIKPNKCANCQKSSAYIKHVRSIYSYQFPIDYWLQQYKFHRQYFYADIFSYLFHTHYSPQKIQKNKKLTDDSHIKTIKVDAIAAIPSHPLRKLSHGFDHTETLAIKLSQQLKLPYIKPLIRNHNGKPLSRLDALSRQHYIKGSYQYRLSSKADKYNCIALVDDIITSGSTAKEAAKCLHSATASAIEIWSIARVL